MGAGNRTLESAPTQRSVDQNHAPLWHSGPHVTNNMAPAKAPWSLRLRCWQLLAVARLSPVDTSSRTVRSGISSGVAQWLACWAHNPKVRGSKPRSAIAFSASYQQQHGRRQSHPGVCAYPKVRGSKPRSAMAFWASCHQQHGAGQGTLESAPAMLAAPCGGATVSRGHNFKDGAHWRQQRSGAVASVLGS